MPKGPEDFAGGGAFPECPGPQHPPGSEGGGGGPGALALSVDASGRADYGALHRQGANAGKAVVHAEHGALVPKADAGPVDELERPGEEEVAATAARTREALERKVNGVLSAAHTKNLAPLPGAARYVKYTPTGGGGAHASGAATRIIKIQDVQVDPLEPPKFRHKKVPRGPGSPPVPVMHSPPRKLTKEDHADWKIPSSISNWKNPKGYTIPLDKRLAADGRGLQQVQINDNFAKLSEALYVAEQKARESVEARARVQKQVLTREKEQREDDLRALAQKARLERQGVAMAEPGPAPAPVRGADGGPAESQVPKAPREEDREGWQGGREGGAHYASRNDYLREEEEREEREDQEARRERDEVREERRRERERERRLEDLDRKGFKRSKATRDRDRDVSERMALGQARIAVGGSEVQYDQRLFNQDQGVASGFAADDQYNLYDKPLFADKGGSLYQPRQTNIAGDDEAGAAAGEQDGLRGRRPDKGFAGASARSGGGGRTSGPVEFEKDAAEDDPFGLEGLLGDVGGGAGERKPLDKVGQGGGMRAMGGGASFEPSGRSKVNFVKGEK